MTKAPILALGFLLAAGAPLYAQGSSSCPPQGDATRAKIRKLNELRARTEEPSDDDYDDTIDMPALIAPGDDSLRWQNDTAVELTAYVVDVHDGGAASSNCHAADAADQDTILELSPGGDVFDAAHRVIAVITPRWRRLMTRNGIDWSTRAIRARYVQRYVSIRGWLLFDFEVAARSLNTAPLAASPITRATAWEIHPVTGIELSDDSFEQLTRLDELGPAYARSNARNSAP